MKADTRREVKRTARKLYRDGRISLEMAVWAMKDAGERRGCCPLIRLRLALRGRL
jgi:hypothetical protein